MDLEMKEKILDEIAALMDEREGEDLKKHPKLMAAKVEVEEPEVEEMPAEEKPKEEEISPEMIQALMDHFKDLK